MPKCSEVLSWHVHDSTGITIALTVLSLSPSAFEQCRMHKPVPQGGVTKLWTRYMCLFLAHSSVAAVFNPYSRRVAAHELQLCHINQPNSHWCWTLQLRLLPPRAQTWQDRLELSCKEKTCRCKQEQATQEAHGPTGQACRDGIRKIKTQVELKLKFPWDLRIVKGSEGFTGTAATKGRPKTVSSLLDRDGEEEIMKCTEKHEVLSAFFASVFSGKISSQVSHTPEATLWGKKHYQSHTN